MVQAARLGGFSHQGANDEPLAPGLGSPRSRHPPRSAAVSWGDNQHGQLGNGSTTASATYAGVSPCAGPGLAGITQIAAGQGFEFDLALRSDGTVWGWGFKGGTACSALAPAA